jgi:hypothetical protein
MNCHQDLAQVPNALGRRSSAASSSLPNHHRLLDASSSSHKKHKLLLASQLPKFAVFSPDAVGAET